MRANVWSGCNTVQVENVPDPKILNSRDAIVKITSPAICGAERVIAIDRFDYRLRMAVDKAGATETINYEERPDVVEELKVMTAGRGPDACIDSVGMEAHHAQGPVYAYDRVK